MKPAVNLRAGIAGLLILLGGCASVSVPPLSEHTARNLARWLHHRGVDLAYQGPARTAYLSAQAEEFAVGKGTLHLFEYQDAAAAGSDYRLLSGKALQSNRLRTWYDGGNLIAIYWGTDERVAQSLTSALGRLPSNAMAGL